MKKKAGNRQGELLRFYQVPFGAPWVSWRQEIKHCFYVESCHPLTEKEIEILKLILAPGFVTKRISLADEWKEERQRIIEKGGILVEVGPRLNFATAHSTNLVSICHTCGLKSITRIEQSRIYLLPEIPDEYERQSTIADLYDRATEQVYPEPLKTFSLNIKPEPVTIVPLKEKGIQAFFDLPGWSLDKADTEYIYNYFVNVEKRNPTIVEAMDLNNSNSEHSRHGYFRGQQIIDGRKMPETLLEIVKSTLKATPDGSVLAFCDNSSAIEGYDCWTIVPQNPGQPSPFEGKQFKYHITFTAETHNFPTGVAPFPGAETGTGGRLRDNMCTGKGAFCIAGTTGYCVGALRLPGYFLPWEEVKEEYPDNLASPQQIEIEASNGASDYGNKFGEPVILGFTRSFDQRLDNGERWAWIKPIMFTAGIGQIDADLIKKDKPQPGLFIVQVGGPAYPIGFGGGAASSMLQGENRQDLDFSAVQRGDAEMEQKLYRVVRTCDEMGKDTPIASIHDQGAGGILNVLKEIVEKAGGRIDIRNIKLGDKTMSCLMIAVAEYQERNAFLIYPHKIEEFKAICEREKVNCEVLGRVTGNGRFVVFDRQTNMNIVDIDLDKVLGKLPQKVFSDKTIKPNLKPVQLPSSLTLKEAIYWVSRNLAVGSKRFLTSKVDRSVTGLIARQQCCGPVQLTVADCAVVAQSHFGFRGAATSIGEQPIKMIIDPRRAARLTVGEALTNLIWARVKDQKQIKASANWMWAPKLPGEGAAIYEAALGMRQAMIKTSSAVDGGKDSLSMATRVGEEIVKSPRQLVISLYAAMPDIRKVVTPDIKRPNESVLIFVDLAYGRARLGGSALAQCYEQFGRQVPDFEKPQNFGRIFAYFQTLLDKGLILAGHDVSDGGLIFSLLEMAFSGNYGLVVSFRDKHHWTRRFFAEELGLVIEVLAKNQEKIIQDLADLEVPAKVVAYPLPQKEIEVKYNSRLLLREKMPLLRSWWEETSYQLNQYQTEARCCYKEKENIFDRRGIWYQTSFKPQPFAVRQGKRYLGGKDKIDVAIVREEGSNGDREMASAFYRAGFRPWDINMTDLAQGKISLEQFRGLAFVGGFSFADDPQSAKGWAAIIQQNARLRQEFRQFYQRPDTFSLGVCNGCQLLALLGWVPWAGIEIESRPQFIPNASGRFESHWSLVKILPSPAIMFDGMDGSVLGIWVAHGEGRLHFPDYKVKDDVLKKNLAPLVYVDDNWQATEKYPFNPNGSPLGLTALCTPDGRHLAMMPHPERSFLKWQWAYLPNEFDKQWPVSPWLRMFQNAWVWCQENKL
jgi:phosphoribosylformylglycinamidine synthase